jgi:hypothetical protein
MRRTINQKFENEHGKINTFKIFILLVEECISIEKIRSVIWEVD